MEPALVDETEGYAEAAGVLIESWRRLSFADRPRAVLNLVPEAPCRVRDMGAGIGVDAFALAATGHRVVAVEPIAEFRAAGVALHPSRRIAWLSDSLPDLDVITSAKLRFELILLSAEWMHLDAPERKRAMPKVASLLRPRGRMILSLRRGSVPTGGRMFAALADDTVQLAEQSRLFPILRLESPPVQPWNQGAGVVWTHLAFENAA